MANNVNSSQLAHVLSDNDKQQQKEETPQIEREFPFGISKIYTYVGMSLQIDVKSNDIGIFLFIPFLLTSYFFVDTSLLFGS